MSSETKIGGVSLTKHLGLLKAVLAGRDPETGEDVTGNPLDNPKTLRGLMRLVLAMEALQLNAGAPGSVQRSRAPWSEVEDRVLTDGFKLSGTECFIVLAAQFERTPRSVAERAVFLGLIVSRAQFVPGDVRLKGLFASEEA